MSPWGSIRSFVGKLSLVATLGLASGCASGLPPPESASERAADVGPTLDSPHVIRVCVKQPGVPQHKDFWGIDGFGRLVLEDWQLAMYQRNGESIYYFDPYASPESTRMLVSPHNTLKCVEPTPSVLLSNGKSSQTTVTREVQRAQETTAQAPTARAAEPPPCTSTSEAGQQRSRSTTTHTCVRSRTLTTPSRKAAPALVTKAEAKPAQKSPTLAQAAPASPSLLDWNVPAPNFSVPALDPQRVVECVSSLCHARHPNFVKKGGKPARGGILEQRSSSTGGGGGKTPKGAPSPRKPPTGPKPAATAKPTLPATPVKPKANEAPKVKQPHGNRVDDRPATRYEKVDKDGNLLKHGVTKHPDPNKRYTKEQLGMGGRAVPKERGPRKEMIKKERDLVETNPGPENREPWAGKRKPQAGAKND